jgi:hypothetical protein
VKKRSDGDTNAAPIFEFVRGCDSDKRAPWHIGFDSVYPHGETWTLCGADFYGYADDAPDARRGGAEVKNHLTQATATGTISTGPDQTTNGRALQFCEALTDNRSRNVCPALLAPCAPRSGQDPVEAGHFFAWR